MLWRWYQPAFHTSSSRDRTAAQSGLRSQFHNTSSQYDRRRPLTESYVHRHVMASQKQPSNAITKTIGMYRDI